MDDKKMNLRALAALMNTSIVGLAQMCGINPNHLKQVSAGNVPMKASDLKTLSKVTGVPIANIYVKGFDD